MIDDFIIYGLQRRGLYYRYILYIYNPKRRSIITTQQLPLHHLVQISDLKQDKTPLLILLHGVGSNEQDLFGLVPYLDERFTVVSVRAPYTRAPGSYAWFDVQFTPQGLIIKPEQAEASRQVLIQFISEAVQTYGCDPQQVYLMGFSQGAIMSASVALTEPELIAGAVLMSGRILPEIKPLIVPAERLAKLPILVVHGVADNVLPIHYGRASRDLLTELGLPLTYQEYLIGHNVSQESIQDISLWLSQQLDRSIL